MNLYYQLFVEDKDKNDDDDVETITLFVVMDESIIVDDGGRDSVSIATEVTVRIFEANSFQSRVDLVWISFVLMYNNQKQRHITNNNNNVG